MLVVFCLFVLLCVVVLLCCGSCGVCCCGCWFGPPSAGPPLRRTAQNFALFFLLPLPFYFFSLWGSRVFISLCACLLVSFFLSLGASRGILVVFEAPQMCTFEVLGLSCETPVPPYGAHPTFSRFWALHSGPSFGAPTLRGPTLRGPHPPPFGAPHLQANKHMNNERKRSKQPKQSTKKLKQLTLSKTNLFKQLKHSLWPKSVYPKPASMNCLFCFLLFSL